MSIIIPEQCRRCVHLNTEQNYRCSAFPDGIPADILQMQHDHRQPHPGDQNIRWEPKEPGTLHPLDEN